MNLPRFAMPSHNDRGLLSIVQGLEQCMLQVVYVPLQARDLRVQADT